MKNKQYNYYIGDTFKSTEDLLPRFAKYVHFVSKYKTHAFHMLDTNWGKLYMDCALWEDYV